MSPGPLFSTPPPLEDPNTKRAFDRLIRESSRELLTANAFMVPLYDSGDPVILVADEQSFPGPKDITATAPNWDLILTAVLNLQPDIPYRIVGTASCDFHARAGVSQETLAIRVNDGTNTLHQLQGTSENDGQYDVVAVPFTLEAEATEQISFTMDGQHVATGGSNPEVYRMRLIVVATPIHLEGGGP